MLDTEKKIVKVASHVDIFLKNYLKKRTENTQLFNALKYGLFSGGKKFRSYLIVTSGKLFNLNYKQLIAIGAAVECMHSYSLIHDDLPSMDDDDFRRGKKSTHKVFGEATAILAGNSLLTLAIIAALSVQKLISSPVFLFCISIIRFLFTLVFSNLRSKY